MAEKTELKQTKNAFKIVGKVTRIDKDNAFKEEVATKGKKEGHTYRSLRFGVKTSDSNEITVSMFDYEPEQVFMWNSDKKKADSSYKGDRIPFAEWEERQDELREEGYAVLQTRIGLDYNEEGKLDSKGLPSFVASKEIFDGLNNGDFVSIEGEIRYSEWENTQTGKTQEQKTYTIRKVHLAKDVDFEDEKFEEITYFEQEFVFVGAEADKKNKKVYVTGRVIDFTQNFHDTTFVVDYADGEGGDDAGMVKLAGAFANKFKFGDLVKVYGDTLNRVIVEVTEDDSTEEDDLLASLGGKSKPTHAQNYTARTYITEMQIHGVEAWDKKVYKDSDFVKNELIEKDDDLGDLGGKKKKDNPFASDGIEIDDDDLPF